MSPRNLAWAGLALLAAAALPLAGLYLAGHLYYLFNRAPGHHIGLDTWWTYWQAYGQLPPQRTRLLLAAAVPGALLVLLLLGVVIAVLPRPRALYGDARWATAREMREAGLL